MLFDDGPVNATKQIQDIHRALLDEIAHAVQFAALGERFARLERDVELPAYGDVLAFGVAPALEAEVLDDFAGQCARLAALSMIGSVVSALRRLFVLRRAAEHAARGVDAEPAPLAGVTAAAFAECRDRNPLAVLSSIVIKARPELDESRKWLEGLLCLRPALSRPRGIVHSDDLPGSLEGIRVVWRRNVVAVDGDQFERLTQVLPSHPGLGLRFVEQARFFRAGQPLRLSSADCDDIAISLSCLSIAVCEQLHGELGMLLASALDG